MPIINRIDMLTTGIRSEVGVKIFGTDLTRARSARARRWRTSLRGVPGASNVYPEQVTSGQYLNIDVDRAAAARYGIGVGDVQQVIETAVGETVLTTTIEGPGTLPGARALRGRSTAPIRRRSAQVLVGAPEWRADSARPARAHRARARAGDDLVGERSAARDGAAQRAGTRRRRIRRGGARRRSRATVTLPAGYYIGWSGRWENQERARAAAADRRADRAAGHLRAALLHLPLARSKPRTCCSRCRSR